MIIRTVEQQIASLRPRLSIHRWFLVLSAILVAIAIIFSSPLPLIFSIFFTIVGIAEHRAASNIARAIRAYDLENPITGEILISITHWDTNNHYYARVYGQDKHDWEYEFIPQGWMPNSRRYHAKIWSIKESEKPLLVVVEEGIIIPRYHPKQL